MARRWPGRARDRWRSDSAGRLGARVPPGRRDLLNCRFRGDTIGVYTTPARLSHRAWRAAVLARDHHRCRWCGAAVDLHVHHVRDVVRRSGAGQGGGERPDALPRVPLLRGASRLAGLDPRPVRAGQAAVSGTGRTVWAVAWTTVQHVPPGRRDVYKQGPRARRSLPAAGVRPIGTPASLAHGVPVQQRRGTATPRREHRCLSSVAGFWGRPRGSCRPSRDPLVEIEALPGRIEEALFCCP